MTISKKAENKSPILQVRKNAGFIRRDRFAFLIAGNMDVGREVSQPITSKLQMSLVSSSVRTLTIASVVAFSLISVLRPLIVFPSESLVPLSVYFISGGSSVLAQSLIFIFVLALLLLSRLSLTHCLLSPSCCYYFSDVPL